MTRAFCAALVFVSAAILAGAALSPVPPILSPAAEVGRQAFRDTRLSASGKMSCASCHEPEHAFAPSNAFAVQMGGPGSDRPGTRTVPSLLYQKFTPAFHFNARGTPVGGFNRDGRAKTLAAQAAIPLMAANEMAAPSKAFVLAKLTTAPYVGAMREAFGSGVFKSPEIAFLALTVSLEAYQRESHEFTPFSSKYDDALAGRAKLSAAEARGLALFNEPDKGNCAACHASARQPNGAPPLFTNFAYAHLGVPRNRGLPSTNDPTYFDLGLCGPERADLAARRDVCGAFKVPTLRNVATRKVFFHNGRFTSLEDAVAFHVRRDTTPSKWYPGRSFDDVPAALARPANASEAPFKPDADGKARLTPSEIGDVAAFLRTLTDDPRPR